MLVFVLTRLFCQIDVWFNYDDSHVQSTSILYKFTYVRLSICKYDMLVYLGSKGQDNERQNKQLTILIYRMGNFVYYQLGCASIYWSLSYPFRYLRGYILKSS